MFEVSSFFPATQLKNMFSKHGKVQSTWTKDIKNCYSFPCDLFQIKKINIISQGCTNSSDEYQPSVTLSKIINRILFSLELFFFSISYGIARERFS